MTPVCPPGPPSAVLSLVQGAKLAHQWGAEPSGFLLGSAESPQQEMRERRGGSSACPCSSPSSLPRWSPGSPLHASPSPGSGDHTSLSTLMTWGSCSVPCGFPPHCYTFVNRPFIKLSGFLVGMGLCLLLGPTDARAPSCLTPRSSRVTSFLGRTCSVGGLQGTGHNISLDSYPGLS